MQTNPMFQLPTLPALRTALSAFTTSPSTFRILHTIPNPILPNHPAPTRLLILDSSFNPPTLAHLSIAISALRSTTPPARLILLLSTRNADKPTTPAPLQHRLAMMALFASDLLDRVLAPPDSPDLGRHPSSHAPVAIDIAVTKHPYFADKAAAIASSGVYPTTPSGAPLEQIHLIGYDTLTRLFDTKYYAAGSLSSLDALFAAHRLRVTYRGGEAWDGREVQGRFVESLRAGEWKLAGARAEWAARIECVEGEGGEGVSSTRVREGAGRGDLGVLERDCTSRVAEWARKEKLYQEASI